MGNIVIEIVLCILLPVGLLCFFLDRKSRSLMVAFMAGIIACLCAYQINNTVNSAFAFGSSYFSTTIAPMIEELLKFVPIFILVKVLHASIKFTAAMSFAVGVGFCVVENLYYLMTESASANIIWVVSRCIGTGLMHSMSATIIGLGVFCAYKEKRIFMMFILSAYFLATMYHGLFNLLVLSSSFQIVGILIPIFSYLLVLLFLNKNELSKILLEDKIVEKEKEQ